MASLTVQLPEKLLQSLQLGELSDEEVNPYYFSLPVAPLIAQRKQRKKITLLEVVRQIRAVGKKCSQLLIEGSGGLLVPLGERFMVADLIAELGGRVIVVGRNRLGTLNHTLLTVEALKAKGLRKTTVVLMDGEKLDHSAETNQKILKELLGGPVVRLPFLGQNARRTADVKACRKKVKKTLAQILR